MECLEERLLLADWSGDIPDGTVWPPVGEPPGTVQRIVGNVRVPSGATLTVEPGTVVKFNDFADFLIAVEGTLIADGTAALPIVFTSFADDTGLDGVLGTADDQDSNGNGPSSGVPSSWQRIEFRAASTGSVLDYVDVRFGGENVTSQVLVDGELTLTNSIVRDSATGGMRIVSANPTIAGTSFRNNAGAAASMDIASNPAISGVTFSGNNVNGLNVDGGTLAQDIAWDDRDIVYRLTSDVTVPVGKTLTIGAGQIVKTTNDISLVVAGTLDANGTVAQPIIFTSDSDDSAGGDTNNNGASTGFPGEPGGIRFSPGSTGSVLDSIEVRFAGDAFVRPALVIDNAQVTIHGGAIRSSASAGLRIINSDPLVSGMTFENNLGAAVSMDLVSNPTITTPTLIENAVNGVALDGFASLTEDAIWDNPDIVYRLVGPLTVPEGMTLTIAPGQIVKARPRVSTEIFVDGTLVANGTVEAPIIFTSDADDSAGGDTNNDGPSAGQFFDWQSIRFRATSTGNLLDHIEVRFAGANAPAAVTVQGATLTMRNSLVRGSANHAVAVRSNGSATLENNIMVNSASDRGAGISSETGSIVTAVNNTIDGNFRGVSVLTSATANLRNNLITNSTSAGIFAENLATVNAVFNDVFNPGRPNYSGLPDLTGQSGNISLDPRYFNRTNLQYRLQAGSPALDAGTSDFAPTTDFIGNPRFDDPNVINRGGGAMPFFDLGAFERQEISFSDVDLATLNVSGPTTGMPNDVVSVNWTVQNLGTGTAIGPWSDAVYLSNDPVWSIDDRLLGRLQHNGDLGPGLSYNATTSVTLTGLLPGRNFFIVRTNDLNQVFGGLAEGNNAAASPSSVDFALPTLTAGSPFADQFTMAGQSHFYQITVAPGQSLNVVLDSAAISGATELYIRQGATPSRSQFDFRSVAVQPDQSLLVPTTGPGTYYILAFANFGAAANSSFTVTASIAGFDVRGVTPNSGANSGRVTIAVQGSGLTLDTQVSLVAPDNSTIPAVATQFSDASQIHATFDLTGRALGSYGVRIMDDALTDTAPGIFTVVTGSPGHLTTHIVAPDRIRRGVAGAITVEYANDGGADLTAPLLLVEAENANLRFPDQPAFRDSSLEFLGINHSGPAGILPPGARGSVQVLFLPKTNANLEFNVSEAISETAFDWNAAKANLRPAEVPTDAWDAIYANFTASIGNTAGQYEAVLARNATYLSQLGEYVHDTPRLLAFELAQADNFGAITRNYTLGALGRGIPDPTDTLVITGANGNVAIRSGGQLRVFVPVPGGLQGVAGDFATLTFVDGVFRLREQDGTIILFLPNGKPNFIEDTNGNRVTAVYTGGRLTGFLDSFGDQITYAYNAQGRISQITDFVGRVITFTYDAAGQHLLSVADPAGTTQFAYVTGQGAAREHAVQSVTLQDGTQQSFEYDTRGRLTRSFFAGNAEELRYSYDQPAATTVTDLSGGRTTIFQNDLGQPGLVQNASGETTRFSYDANHMLIRVTGPGSQGDFGYDDRGHPISAMNSLGQRLDFTFESAFSRLLSVRDSRGNTLNFNSDAHGNPRSITHPDGSTEQFTYDATGNITESVSRSGQVTRFTYDAHNLVIREDFADETQANFTYDARRNLVSATDAAGTTAFLYDTADRITRVTYPGGRFLQFTYDAAGRRIRSADQDGFTVNYAYDAIGRLSELTNAGNQRIVAYSYNATGQLIREDRGNGTVTTYAYDAGGRVISLVNQASGGAVLSQFDYAYDALDRRTSVTALDGTTTYTYDAAGQLTGVSLPGGRVITYQYDAAGNRISVVDSGNTTNYTTNNLNEYTAVGAATYTYNADGNLIAKTDGSGTTTYAYDARGRLVSVATPTDQFTFQYDALGNRIATIQNGQRTDHLIDPLGNSDVVAQYDSGGLIAHYVHGFGLASRVDGAGMASFYSFDGAGNTAQLTGPTGLVQDSYSHLPFGELLSQTGTTPNPFTYNGRFGVMREGAGLSFMRNRFYDAAVGRFISPDPIGLTGGDVNLYRYVNNQPTGFADPRGLAGGATVRLRPPAATQAIRQLRGKASFQRPPRPGSPFSKGGAALVQGITTIVQLVFADVTGEDNEDVKEAAKVILLTNFATAGGGAVFFTLLGAAGVVTVTVAASATTLLAIGAAAAVYATAGYLIGTLIRDPIQDFFVFKPYYYFHPVQKDIQFGDTAKRILAVCQGLQLTSAECKREREKAGLTQVAPTDPNDIGGPPGFGPQHFITGEGTLPYIILFENKPEATAPAVRVEITQQLDPDLDWTTFELGSFGFGDRMFEVPAGRRFYSTRLDLTETIGEYVDVTAGIDLVTGEATWTFTSIDPATGEQATDIDAGFLPPDQDPPEGEGFVNYTIQALPALATGTTINAQASIRFDVEDVIDTPLYVNTIDAGNPTSSVASLPAQSPPSFTVSWSGSDDAGGPTGSGIASFDIFVSDNGGPFQLFRDDTTATSATFTGERGHTYGFFSVATDNIGFVQPTPTSAHATTTVPTDTTAPTLQNMPTDRTVTATGPAGEAVTYTLPTATDDIDTSPDISCLPASGSTFVIGMTTVTCTATDDAGNSDSETFQVTVLPPDTTGPTIDRIDLVRDARGKKVLRIVLTFSESLNETGAETLANYVLETRTRRRAKPIALGSAVYNAGTVTLTPVKAISTKKLATVFLTARATGTLTDSSPNLNALDGDRNGTPGGDFVRSLSQGAILSVVDELLESGELAGRHRFSESLESLLARLVGFPRPTQ